MAMSKLRPNWMGLKDSDGKPIPYDTALFLIRDSVARRRSLIFGKLHNAQGESCAIGCFFDDNPRATLSSALIDEVAAVNDSIPPTVSAHERWKKVNSWLRWKINVLAGKEKSA